MKRLLPALLAAFLVAGVVYAQRPRGFGGPNTSSTPTTATSPIVAVDDGGTVNISTTDSCIGPSLCEIDGGANIFNVTNSQPALQLMGHVSKGALKTLGGSGAGDIVSGGDLYACTGLGFSVAYATCGVNADGVVSANNVKNRVAVTLDGGGSGSATIGSGAYCTCSDTETPPVTLQVVTSGATLTVSEAGGSSAHVVHCLCF